MDRVVLRDASFAGVGIIGQYRLKANLKNSIERPHFGFSYRFSHHFACASPIVRKEIPSLSNLFLFMIELILSKGATSWKTGHNCSKGRGTGADCTYQYTLDDSFKTTC